MKIIIVGCGAVASSLSKLLSKKHSVICVTNKVRLGRKFIKKSIPIVFGDARNISKMKKICGGADLIINASLPNFNASLMRVALAVNSNYQDLCSWLLDLKHPEQLVFDKQFRKKNLVALINTGGSPGITNLLAAKIVNSLGVADKIEFRLLEEQKAQKFFFSWSAAVTADELTAPVLGYKKKFFLKKPFADAEVFSFPKPFGKKEVVNVYGDEVSTIPLFLPVTEVDYKSGGSDIVVAQHLNAAGLLSKKKVRVGNTFISPIEFLGKVLQEIPAPKENKDLIRKKIIEDGVLIMTVVGRRGKKKKQFTAVCPSLREIQKKHPGATYISYPTAAAAAAFTEVIPLIKEHGVFPPEKLNKSLREKVLKSARAYGIRIS